MSWGTTATNISRDSFEADLAEAIDGYRDQLASSDYDLDDVANEQVTAAAAAAKALVDSGAIGAGPFNLSINGHANPGHAPREGWANDVITVQVASVEVVAPVDPAPVDPAPVDPAPVDPAPVDPAPVDPAPVDPAPVDPATTSPSPNPSPSPSA